MATGRIHSNSDNQTVIEKTDFDISGICATWVVAGC